MARGILLTASTFSLMLFAGCAMHEIYGDHALPESERALIDGYSRYQVLYFEDLQIVSVDGRREGGHTGWPYASSVSVQAGRHWIQVLILRNSTNIAMCAFEWMFEAKHNYKLQQVNHGQFLLAHPSSPRFPASVSMVVTGPSNPPQQLRARAECGKATHCRQTSECPPRYTCEMDTSFEFGICNSHDR